MTPDPSASTQKNVHYLFQPLGEYSEILRNDLSPLNEGVKIIAHDFLSDFQRFFCLTSNPDPSSSGEKR